MQDSKTDDQVIVDTQFYNSSHLYLKLLKSDEHYKMMWEYGAYDKDWMYVGHDTLLHQLDLNFESVVSRQPTLKKPATVVTQFRSNLIYNALAVFPGYGPGREHGYLGLTSSGSPFFPTANLPHHDDTQVAFTTKYTFLTTLDIY